ncbi:ATP-binding protein [Parafrankia sp. BMG5.11]|uniref:sensor histidine kinase n=1 Tax=Parafrankia sp. BMG5.11 TaxID=222540 RepID=UPI001405281B|nr:ATP-binding protein [Parafrankia sp. BMG5.11]
MTQASSGRRSIWRDSRLIAGIAALVLLALAGWISERWARTSANEVADAEALQLARSNALLFDSELQKFRLLPAVLAEYPDVSTLLRAPASDPLPLNRRLEVLAARTGAIIYVIGADGRTLAASNHRLPTSFVGQNYGFRPYFTDALARGASELFALGTVSGRPGLFIARRIGPTQAPLGAVVVKIEFDRLEASWRAQAGTTFVSDAHDVVIVSSLPEWRFHRLRPLRQAEKAEIARTRQFDDLPLAPLPVSFSGRDARFEGDVFRRADTQVALAGAKLTALLRLEPALAGARARARQALLGIVIVLGSILLWLVRQRERLQLQRAAQRELEVKVLERTAELREVNAQLVTEGVKRQRSEERYRRSREELAQANRLATLGQVAAGVAHEINQPVAAIRTFSENAVAFLGRGMADNVGDNLAKVVELTERISQITGELRNFARRKTPSVGPVRLDEAIDAALLLVHHRIAGSSVRVSWDAAAADQTVSADRVRLEQVFVNLIQNALDAIGDRPHGRLDIQIEAEGDLVAVSFADNGGGVSAAVRRKLFTPFVTGRDDGLGRGLAIARDILREFGGDLSLTSTGAKGTVFTASLVPA